MPQTIGARGRDLPSTNLTYSTPENLCGSQVNALAARCIAGCGTHHVGASTVGVSTGPPRAGGVSLAQVREHRWDIGRAGLGVGLEVGFEVGKLIFIVIASSSQLLPR